MSDIARKRGDIADIYKGRFLQNEKVPTESRRCVRKASVALGVTGRSLIPHAVAESI